MSIEEFAEILGIDPDTYRSWETGRAIQPKHADTLLRMLAKLLYGDIGAGR